MPAFMYKNAPSVNVFTNTRYCSLSAALVTSLIALMGEDVFIAQHDELANFGVDFDTPTFEDTAKMTAFYEANKEEILVWADKQGLAEGYQDGYQWLDDVDNMYSGYDAYEIYRGLHDSKSEPYDDVVKTLMMEVGHNLCLGYQAYLTDYNEHIEAQAEVEEEATA